LLGKSSFSHYKLSFGKFVLIDYLQSLFFEGIVAKFQRRNFKQKLFWYACAVPKKAVMDFASPVPNA
jgi:hypothetical protein